MESFSAPTANDECEGWWDNGDADDSDAESLNSDVTDDDVSFTFIRHHSISMLAAVKIVFMQYISIHFSRIHFSLFCLLLDSAVAPVSLSSVAEHIILLKKWTDKIRPEQPPENTQYLNT
jgi:hypothetical protein